MGLHNFKVMVIGCVYVELFTGDDEVAGSGVLKCVNVVLGDKELLLLTFHADEVDANFVNDRGLLAIKGREAGNFGHVIAWEVRVHDQ